MAVAGKRQNPAIRMCDPCLYVKETTDAVGFCSECVEYLCSDCIKYHKKIKATREHFLYIGEDLPSDTSSFERIKSLMKCCKHSDQNIMYLCNDHSEHICIKCAREGHITCSIAEITVLVNEEKSKEVMRQYLSKTTDSDIDMIQKKIQNNILTLSEERKQAIEKRNGLIDLLRKTIENLELSCLGIEQVFTEITENLNEKQRKSEDKSGEKKEMKSFLQTMLTFGTPIHLYLAANAIQSDDIEHGCTETFNEIYYLEDSIGSDIPDLLQAMSTMSFKVALKQDKPIENKTETSDSNELAQEIDDEITHFSPNQLEKAQVRQKTHLKTISETNSAKVSIPPQAKYKTTTLRTKKAGLTVHEIFLEGPGFKDEDLDVAATNSGVIVIALRYSGSVLFLDNTFTLIEIVTLPYHVLGVCCIDKLRIAIAWSDKRVRKYAIADNAVRLYNDFTLSRNCCCISGNGQKIICLYADSISDGDHTAERGSVYIEIRDQFSGTICTKTSLEMTANNIPRWAVFLPPSTGEVFISNGLTVKVISETGRELREMHHSGISSITGDNTGNICMFQKPSNFVVMLPKGSQQANTYRVEKLFGAAMTYCTKLDSWVLLGFKRP